MTGATDLRLTPDLMLKAYAAGIFPMAERREDQTLFWVEPERRGIIPLDGFHISRSLARSIRRADYTISCDRNFAAVVAACADRRETWINAELHGLYGALHSSGHAHSLEVWAGDDLIGGLFGIALAGAFFGESMFSRRRDASKMALAYLVDRLRAGGFALLDAQFMTDHLRSIGAIEISRRDYRDRLDAAMALRGDFARQPPEAATPSGMMQRMTHTS